MLVRALVAVFAVAALASCKTPATPAPAAIPATPAPADSAPAEACQSALIDVVSSTAPAKEYLSRPTSDEDSPSEDTLVSIDVEVAGRDGANFQVAIRDKYPGHRATAAYFEVDPKTGAVYDANVAEGHGPRIPADTELERDVVSACAEGASEP